MPSVPVPRLAAKIALLLISLALLGSIQVQSIPQGFVTFFEGSACPTNWSVVPATQGRLIVSVSDPTQAGVQVGTALENKQSPSHTHTIVATALLSPKLTLAKDGLDFKSARAGSYDVTGSLRPSESGYPLAQWLLCALQIPTPDPVPIGTLAFFVNLDSCPPQFAPVPSVTGRVVVPAYGASPIYLSPESALKSGEDRPHSHGFTAVANLTDIGLDNAAPGSFDKVAAAGEVLFASNGSGVSSDSSHLPYVQLLTCESQQYSFDSSGFPNGSLLFNLLQCPPGWTVDTRSSGRLLVSLPSGAQPGAAFGAAHGLPSSAPNSSEPLIAPHDHTVSGDFLPRSVGVSLNSTSVPGGFAKWQGYVLEGLSSDQSCGLPYAMLPLCKRVVEDADASRTDVVAAEHEARRKGTAVSIPITLA